MTSAKPSPEDRDDAWEALTLGTLSKEEEALLRALAEEGEAEALKLEAHAPLDEAFRARTVDKLAEQIAAQRKVRRLPARVLPFAGAALAIAAAVALALLPRGNELPAYTLAVQGSVAETRGATAQAEVLRLKPDSEIDLTLTPERAVEGEVVLTVGVVGELGVVLAHEPQVERAPSGAVRLTGTMEELFRVPPGRYELLAVVEREPVSATELKQRADQHDPRVHRATLVYEGAP